MNYAQCKLVHVQPAAMPRGAVTTPIVGMHEGQQLSWLYGYLLPFSLYWLVLGFTQWSCNPDPTCVRCRGPMASSRGIS
jgi:hypothetical protein